MEGLSQPIPRTVEEVFSDFKGRRAGMIKTLTADVEKFYQQCDPEKENLCLYGFPNETWQENLPVEEVPFELPEPALGMGCKKRTGYHLLQFTVTHGCLLFLSILVFDLALVRMRGKDPSSSYVTM